MAGIIADFAIIIKPMTEFVMISSAIKSMK